MSKNEDLTQIAITVVTENKINTGLPSLAYNNTEIMNLGTLPEPQTVIAGQCYADHRNKLGMVFMKILRTFPLALLILLLIFSLSACGAEQNTIEGYWLSEGGSEISFASDGAATLDGVTTKYSVLDEDTIKINILFAETFFYYTLEGDTLILQDTTEGVTETFYRGKDKQDEIRSNLEKAQNGETVLYDNDILTEGVENWNTVEKIADNQILSKYKTTYPDTNYGYFYEKSVTVEGKNCEELRFYESYPERDRYFAAYAICPDDGTIFVDNYMGDGYVLWDGESLY